MPADLDPHHELPEHPEFLELPLPEKVSFFQIMIFGLAIFGLVMVVGSWVLSHGSSKLQPESVSNNIEAQTSPPSIFSPNPSPNQIEFQPYPETDLYSNSLFHYSFSHSPELTIRYAYDQASNRTDRYNFAEQIYLDDRDEIEETILSVGAGGQVYGKDYEDAKSAVEDNFQYSVSSTANFLSPENSKIEGPYNIYIHEGDLYGDRSIEAYKYLVRWQDDPAYSDGSSGTSIFIYIPIELGGRSAGMGTYTPFKFITLQYELENEELVQPIVNSFVVRPQ